MTNLENGVTFARLWFVPRLGVRTSYKQSRSPVVARTAIPGRLQRSVNSGLGALVSEPKIDICRPRHIRVIPCPHHRAIAGLPLDLTRIKKASKCLSGGVAMVSPLAPMGFQIELCLQQQMVMRNAMPNGQQCAENWPCSFIDDELWPASYTAMCSCPRYVGPNILVSAWHSTPLAAVALAKPMGIVVRSQPRVKGVVDPKHRIVASAAFEPSRCLMNGTVVVSSGDSAERVEGKLEKGNRKGPTSGSRRQITEAMSFPATPVLSLKAVSSGRRQRASGGHSLKLVANGMHVPLGYLSCVSG
ncbi:unnamed protein product [Fusarium graminearum]|nr:unnamed protein product [Fusarium graminearum]